MDIKNLLFNILLAGLTSYIISNLFFYFAKKDKKNKYTLKEIILKENKPKEKKAEEKTEEEEHKESKEKIFDYFKNGVPYSEKEYEALNKFLDDLQLIGLKFLQHDGYIEVIKEYSSWDMYGYFDLYGFMRSVYVKLDRVKGCLKIDNLHSSNDYRFRVNCEKIKPLIDRFNKTMGYEEEVQEVEELKEDKCVDKEEPNSEGTQKKYPSHYYINGRNTIEIIKDIVNKNAKTVQEGIDLFNVLKYLIRYRNKNKVDDLQKARNYLDWLIKEVEEQELSTLND